jgi:hypothetical protein
MHGSILHSGWETALIAAPFLIMLVVGVFRLDGLFATQKSTANRQRPVVGTDKNGQLILCDPDGRPCSPPRRRK